MIFFYRKWTVKKETELEAKGPIGGDEMTIRKQQVILLHSEEILNPSVIRKVSA